MGLEVYLTELDVNDDAVRGPDVPDAVPATASSPTPTAITSTAALESKAVKAVLTWGLTDRYTWLNGIKSHKEKRPDRSQRPAAFRP